MKFSSPLLPGKLIKRYKRFLADIELSCGSIITAHCPNSGAMTGLLSSSNQVWLSTSINGKRRHPMTLEMIQTEETLVGINTQNPNRIVFEALNYGLISPLTGYTHFAREVSYDDRCRIDLYATAPFLPPCYIEVKNVHLKIGNSAQFPDSVTERGRKHLLALSRVAAQKARAVLIYIIQRNDIEFFTLAHHIDPQYAQAAAYSQSLGVEMYAYCCNISPEEIRLSHAVPLLFQHQKESFSYAKDQPFTHL